jgi:cyclopropane-fatty-acyl-phospholipid synthase
MLRYRLLDQALSHHLLPDPVLLVGSRLATARRLRSERAGGVEAQEDRLRSLVWHMSHGPIAERAEPPSEPPAEFVTLFLGPRHKYSCTLWTPGIDDLATAEEAMLRLTCARAEIEDGMDVLDLGCGWGSLTLWVAEQYPNASVTGISDSRAQREHVQAEAARRGLANVSVASSDDSGGAVDRVVSIEMFEHMRNYERLLANIAAWLRPGGKLFAHIFCHCELLYPFEANGEDDWMGRHFFTGGLMPSADTLLWFQRDLRIEEQWHLSGTHYERTANAWLANHDTHAAEILDVLRMAYADQAPVWNQRWRMFWMACAELFGYRGGNEWLVAHYRFAK